MDPIFISKSFDSFEKLVTLFPDWKLDFIQLSSGKFVADCSVYTDNSVRIVELFFNKHLHHRGVAPNKKNYTFSVYHPDSSIHRWRYIDCPPNSIVTFPRNTQLHSVSLPGLHRYFFMIDDTLAAKIARKRKLPAPKKFIKRGGVSICQQWEIEQIQDKMQSIFKQLKEQQKNAVPAGLKQQDRDELIGLFLLPLSTSPDISQKNKQLARAKVIQQIIDHVESDLSASRNIAELSKIVNLSERTFRNFFYEIISIAPKKYLKSFSLHAARKALQGKDASRYKISDIARVNGFFHMGQFSADYKKQFNELPSDTLKTRWQD